MSVKTAVKPEWDKATHAMDRLVESTAKGARKMKARLGRVMRDTPEYMECRRKDHVMRKEIDSRLLALGKQVWHMHKHAHGVSPFASIEPIMEELNKLDRVQEEYRENKVHLNTVREDMRGKTPRFVNR